MVCKPAVSPVVRRTDLTIAWFRDRPASAHPACLAQRASFLRGLNLAGVPDS
jgi:hypothetical protein